MMADKSTASAPNGVAMQDLLYSTVEKIGRDVSHLSIEFNKKFDETDRDTRRQFEAFGNNMANQFQQITNKFESALTVRDTKIEAVSTRMLESKQTPWALMISMGVFILALVGSIGGLAYYPVIARTANVERALEKVADNQTVMRDFVTANFVTQKELDTRGARGAEDRDRTNRVLEKMQDSVFPKEVHEQRWARFDAEFLATNLRLDTHVQNLQREIDALQRQMGDTYTARDVIMESRNRITELERLIRDILTRRETTP